MAKFYDVTEENMNLIDQKYQETGMHNYIDLKIRGISKQKEVIKVVKTNPQAADLGNCPDSIVCYVYEDAFDRLDDEQRSMLVEDAFANVSYDDEKDKIIVGGPQISVSIGGWKKYGEKLISAAEIGQYAIAQIEEEKKAAKEAEKAEKAAKKKQK
jgi:hypothetical protein